MFTRWEGMELMNFSPFIYAFEQTNIAITGNGTIDGNADCEHWWPWKGRTECGWKNGDVNQDADRNALFEMGERNVPVASVCSDRAITFGRFHPALPLHERADRGRASPELADVASAPGALHQCHRQGSAYHQAADGPNTDGCDPESCTDVLITNC